MSWLDKYSHKSAQQSNSQPKTVNEAIDMARNEAEKYRGMTYQQAFFQMCKERKANPKDQLDILLGVLGGNR